MADLNKIANVLEAAAEYIEEREREKTSAITSARAARLDKIAAAHLATHGEEMPVAARQKLATTDDATLDVIEDLLAKQAGVVAPLGGGVDADNESPRTVKEAADAADERFKNWIVS